MTIKKKNLSAYDFRFTSLREELSGTWNSSLKWLSLIKKEESSQGSFKILCFLNAFMQRWHYWKSLPKPAFSSTFLQTSAGSEQQLSRVENIALNLCSVTLGMGVGGVSHSLKSALSRVYRDGSHSPGNTFQSFCIMWNKAPAALLSPYCLAASRRYKQETGGHRGRELCGLSNQSKRITGTHLHQTLKQFGRVINSNLFFSFYGIAQISHWKSFHWELESKDEGFTIVPLCTSNSCNRRGCCLLSHTLK